MPKDTSLSEFAGTTDEPDERPADEPGAEEQVDDEPVTEERAEDEPIGTDETDVSELDFDDIEPARATYDWTPDGADCACCGTSIEKRWRDEDGMVCADCKEW